MQDDRMRLRAHLARLSAQLLELDLIEQAEKVVRHSYEVLLLEEFLEIDQELRDARRVLTSLARRERLIDLLVAEEQLRAGQTRHATLQRRSAVEAYACRRARQRYTAKRIRLLRNINQLQMLLHREGSVEAPRR